MLQSAENPVAPRRVLLVSPHYPPSTLAGVHRARLLGRRLPEFGWEPTILAAHPSGYEEPGDVELERLAAGPRVVRYSALSHRWTRPFGVGDLGLRGLRGCLRGARRLLRQEPFDVLMITLAPYYTALLGPILKREFGVPFVLDYQDPWVSAWGAAQPWASKPGLHHAAARVLEPRVLEHVDLLTAVSVGTYREILARNRWFSERRCAAFPIGGDAGDFEYLRAHPRPSPALEAARRRRPGAPVLAAVGTLLPRAGGTLEGLLGGLRELRRGSPALAAPTLLFVGTSNQPGPGQRPLVTPVAQRLGVGDLVCEVPERIPYVDAINALVRCDGILMLGSDEPHYTASKLYPGLLAGRPIVAAYRRESSVVEFTAQVGGDRVRLITYGDADPAATKTREFAAALGSIPAGAEAAPLDPDAFFDCSARGVSQGFAQRFEALLGA